MANAKKMTRTEVVTVGVELVLSLEEAALLKAILGNIGSTDTTNRVNKMMVHDMWEALAAAGVVSALSPYTNEVNLK